LHNFKGETLNESVKIHNVQAVPLSVLLESKFQCHSPDFPLGDDEPHPDRTHSQNMYKTTTPEQRPFAQKFSDLPPTTFAKLVVGTHA
jgi:hypothetical protein